MTRIKKILILKQGNPLFTVDANTDDCTPEEFEQRIIGATCEFFSKMYDSVSAKEHDVKPQSRIKVSYKDGDNSGFFFVDWTFIPYYF